jgi:hypothetical protein
LAEFRRQEGAAHPQVDGRLLVEGPETLALAAPGGAELDDAPELVLLAEPLLHLAPIYAELAGGRALIAGHSVVPVEGVEDVELEAQGEGAAPREVRLMMMMMVVVVMMLLLVLLELLLLLPLVLVMGLAPRQGVIHLAVGGGGRGRGGEGGGRVAGTRRQEDLRVLARVSEDEGVGARALLLYCLGKEGHLLDLEARARRFDLDVVAQLPILLELVADTGRDRSFVSLLLVLVLLVVVVIVHRLVKLETGGIIGLGGGVALSLLLLRLILHRHFVFQVRISGGGGGGGGDGCRDSHGSAVKSVIHWLLGRERLRRYCALRWRWRGWRWLWRLLLLLVLVVTKVVVVLVVVVVVVLLLLLLLLLLLPNGQLVAVQSGETEVQGRR